jgi:hypothetical protein
LAKRGKALIKRWKVYFESQESNHKDELKKNKNLTPPSDDNNSNSCSATKLSENSAPAFKNRDMPKDEVYLGSNKSSPSLVIAKRKKYFNEILFFLFFASF